jgi:hypothetical protein
MAMLYKCLNIKDSARSNPKMQMNFCSFTAKKLDGGLDRKMTVSVAFVYFWFMKICCGSKELPPYWDKLN